jgi:uncharacterized protein DUF4242
MRPIVHLRKEDAMPRFMDVHNESDRTKGFTPEQVAEFHRQDLAAQAKHGVRYLKYWYDPSTGKAFCLSEAPSKEAVMAVHRDAHGYADEIFEVFEVFEGE